MKVHAFLHVVFQKGAWKKGWPEAGRITYTATEDRASIEILCSDEDKPLRVRAPKKAKIQISGNSIHLPDDLL